MQENFYLIFWDSNPEILPEGLRGQPSPDHVSMGWQMDETFIHLDPYYSHVDKTVYSLMRGYEKWPTIMENLSRWVIDSVYSHLIVDNPKKTLHSIFEIQICKPPKLDLKLYTRPMYCFNYVIHTIGMQVGQVFTTKDLYDKVTSYSGKTNFISRKIYPWNHTGN